MGYRIELQEAIEEGNLQLFSNLFSESDLDCNDYEGSLLHAASMFGTVELVEFLVRNGAEVDRLGGTFNAPALTYAAEEDLEIVKFLIEEANATIDVSHPSRNPLFRALEETKVDIVQYLLNKGVDPHLTYRLPNGKLVNAFTKAERTGNEKLIMALQDLGCRNPIEGEDKPVWEPSQGRMLNHIFAAREIQTTTDKRYHEIIRYMERRFGTADHDGMQELVPVIEGMTVAINIIQPNEKHPFWVFFTNGMSDLPMNVPSGQEVWQYAELVMHLPANWVHPRKAETDLQWLWPIKWMRTIAYQPHLNDSWLGLPAALVSSSDPPQPLGPNTLQSCFLMLPDHSNLKPPLVTEEKQIHFYTMVPIYTEERNVELEHGMDEFFKQFMRHEVPLTIDLNRQNFALT